MEMIVLTVRLIVLLLILTGVLMVLGLCKAASERDRMEEEFKKDFERRMSEIQPLIFDDLTIQPMQTNLKPWQTKRLKDYTLEDAYEAAEDGFYTTVKNGQIIQTNTE